jgi:hypothetical protein
MTIETDVATVTALQATAHRPKTMAGQPACLTWMIAAMNE